jgi:lipid II:glycine glycyltransferase (peptidoglycan interpeptide bridge formation enzyme)
MTMQRQAPALALIEPDDVAWDAFVASHSHGHVLQSSGWGRVKSDTGWGLRRLAIGGPGGIVAGAQVLFRRRLGLCVAYVPRGPLFAEDATIDDLLLTALDRLARRARAVFLRLEPNMLERETGADELHSQLLLRGFQTAEPFQPRTGVHLDLAPPPEQLLAAMTKGHRADVRRAARDGVTVRAGGHADIAQFYAILQLTSARAHFGIHQQRYYDDVLRYFGDQARLWLAERAGTPQATALTVAWGQDAAYLFGGSTDEGLKSGAQHAIQWQAIQWARAQGCARYDFWGIPDAVWDLVQAADDERERLEATARSGSMYGVYRFKKGFGGKVVRYLPAYDRVYIPPIYALWRRRGG